MQRCRLLVYGTEERLLCDVLLPSAGLLEGAHQGVGLGHEFLRHTQRCRVLVHVIDGTSPDPIGDYNAIRVELELFNPALIEKPEVWAPSEYQVKSPS